MQARIKHPVMVFPAAMKGLIALCNSTGDTLPESTRNLIYLRASQINGCSVCLEMHATDMRKAGESDERIFTVAGWRDAPYFSDAERAALALTEATTRIADRADAVPDDVWDRGRRALRRGAARGAGASPSPRSTRGTGSTRPPGPSPVRTAADRRVTGERRSLPGPAAVAGG